MTVDPILFRQVMSRFASGVTVVTGAHDGQLYGLTVSSFASLSLEPRLAMVCLDLRTQLRDVIISSGHFAINILAADQEQLSRHFAGPNKGDWSAIPHTLGLHGVPLLDGSLATLQCRLHQHLPGGDHTIVIGELEAASASEGAPLIYSQGGYARLEAQ